MASKGKVPKPKRPPVKSRKMLKSNIKVKPVEKTDREIYSKGKRAEKNYQKTMELFKEFFDYLQRQEKVPSLPLGKRVRCPIERFRKYYEEKPFPLIDSSDYIALRKYIDDNKSMWESFTASRRSKNRIKKLKKSKRYNKKLKKEVKLLKSLSKGFLLKENNTIPDSMKMQIKDKYSFLSDTKNLENIIAICQLTVGYLMANTAFREAFVAYKKDGHNPKINDHIRYTLSRFHEISLGK